MYSIYLIIMGNEMMPMFPMLPTTTPQDEVDEIQDVQRPNQKLILESTLIVEE